MEMKYLPDEFRLMVAFRILPSTSLTWQTGPDQFGSFQFVSRWRCSVGQLGVGLNGVPFALEARRAVLLFEKAVEGISEIAQG
jgi:hypothetical protein